MTRTTTAAADKPLTFTQFETLKAIPRGEITMSLDEPGTWRRKNGNRGYVVTSSMRPLIERRLVAVDLAYHDGVRGCRLTAKGNEELSRANHNRPKKRRR
jgi:hypothetical protein